MSYMMLSSAMERIRSAPVHSRIAVFRTETRGLFDVMFADTVTTRQRIDQDKRFIGVYHGAMDLDAVRKHLSLCARGCA